MGRDAQVGAVAVLMWRRSVGRPISLTIPITVFRMDAFDFLAEFEEKFALSFTIEFFHLSLSLLNSSAILSP